MFIAAAFGALIVAGGMFVIYALWDSAIGAVTSVTDSVTDSTAPVESSGYYYNDQTVYNECEWTGAGETGWEFEGNACKFYLPSGTSEVLVDGLNEVVNSVSTVFLGIGAVYAYVLVVINR
jgi:hypothetical protein